MILVDTSVWVDHLRSADAMLDALLDANEVVVHPFVIGEVALGNLGQRELILRSLQDLPQAEVATDQEVLRFVDASRLFGSGIGYIDAHLLASVRLASGTRIWTRDKRLHGVAESLGLSHDRLH